MWRILWRDQDVTVDDTPVTIGRSASCRLVVDDTEVSRVHARFIMEGGELWAEDQQSTNGVWVNDERIRGRRKLRAGDRIGVGTEELVAAFSPDVPVRITNRLSSPRRTTAAHLPDTSGPAPSSPSPRGDMLPTEKADALQTLGRLADRMLVAGRMEAAERVMAQHLRNVLASVQRGDPVAEEVVQTCTVYALKFADALKSSDWSGYVLELHIALERPLGQEVAKKLSDLIRVDAGAPRSVLDRYRRVLRTGVSQMRFNTMRPEEHSPTVPPPPPDPFEKKTQKP